MLMAAAGSVARDADKCRTQASVVHGPNNQSLKYAELASGRRAQTYLRSHA